jgi:hypothetical protein
LCLDRLEIAPLPSHAAPRPTASIKPKFDHDVGRTSGMRTILLISVLVIAVLAIVHETHAHAGEPTRCGFWDSIEAGLSCR